TTDVELDYQSETILQNHNKGLYFLQILRNKRVYFFNGSVELFRIENKSVHITEGPEQQQRREGPAVTEIYNFTEDVDLEEIQGITDNHIEFLTDRGITNKFFLNPDNSIIDKERLLNISTGKIQGGNNWLDVIHLNSFNLKEADECNNRLTY